MQTYFAWMDNPGQGWKLIHTKRIRLRNGRVLFAEHYGLKCFTFWVRNKKK